MVAIAGVGLTMILLIGLGDLATFFLARTTAQTAADAAALAAAAELIPGIGAEPHTQAQRFASANGGRLVGCECSLSSGEVVVTVAVPVRFVLGRIGGETDVRARARAEVVGF